MKGMCLEENQKELKMQQQISQQSLNSQLGVTSLYSQQSSSRSNRKLTGSVNLSAQTNPVLKPSTNPSNCNSQKREKKPII